MSSPVEPGYKVAQFTLAIGERRIEATAQVPAAEVRIADLLPVLRKFNDAVIGVSVAEAEDRGETVSCCAGCGACCRQAVPIAESEALALIEWVETLPPAQQELLRARFKQATQELDSKGVLELTRRANQLRAQPELVQFALNYFDAGVPCPFLIKESCSIHPIRPMKCREYLVTSPAVNCQSPTPETIRKVSVPKPFSRILFHLENHMAPGWGKWIPLVLLFEWAEQKRHLPQRTADGASLFQEVVGALGDVPAENLSDTFGLTGLSQQMQSNEPRSVSPL